MKIILFFLLLCPIIGQCEIIHLNSKFIRAIHMVETGGRVGNIPGDNGKAKGPLQIWESYFRDAQDFNPELKKYRWQDCARLDVSVLVMESYLNRYAREACKKNDMEILSRRHNGGPVGDKKKSTLIYWEKVKKFL